MIVNVAALLQSIAIVTSVAAVVADDIAVIVDLGNSVLLL